MPPGWLTRAYSREKIRRLPEEKPIHCEVTTILRGLWNNPLLRPPQTQIGLITTAIHVVDDRSGKQSLVAHLPSGQRICFIMMDSESSFIWFIFTTPGVAIAGGIP